MAPPPGRPNPYKASCCQSANDSPREKVRHFFARPIAPLWSVDRRCLMSAPWFRDQKRSCPTHVSRFQPPAGSSGCARRVALRHLATLLCPGAVPVNAAGSACVPAVPCGPGSGTGQTRQPGVCARGGTIAARNGPPIHATGCRDCRSAQAPLVRAQVLRA
jgi:hypothetical protein